MVRTQTMVQLTDELLLLLDREASRRGLSRSAVIRSVLEAHFAGDSEALVGARIVEGYRRIPPATPDEWGDLEAANERTNRELMRRLDAEERAQGLAPWRTRRGRRAVRSGGTRIPKREPVPTSC